VHENAPKCCFSNSKISKFSGEEHSPSQTPPLGEGVSPLPTTHPLDAFGVSTSPPSAARCPSTMLVPLQLAVAGDAAENTMTTMMMSLRINTEWPTCVAGD